MRLAELVATSRAVGESASRLQKADRLAALLRRIPEHELDAGLAFLIGSTRQGRLGVGGALISAAHQVAASPTATLELSDVDAVFEKVAVQSGPGSGTAKVQLLRTLFGRATADEQDFLVRLLFGELRQGALEGVMLEAVAKASGIEAKRLRRAAMMAGALVPVARAALVRGAAALDELIVRPFYPVQPMLAESASDVEAAIGELGEALFEYKLDGARVQVHKVGNDVRVFSRTLNDVTAAVPEIVEAAQAVSAHEAILDGEAIALRLDGTPHPFQVTMRRFGRRLEVDRLRATLPITPMFFDCLYADGGPLIDEPLLRRADIMSQITPAGVLVPRVVTSRLDQAGDFLARAMAAGHEGVMAKHVAAPYTAGRRGQAWLKVKQARTLDLVILAAEWGSGRRRGKLSNLHLGARNDESGGFVMLGKTFKGLTDEMLEWQTARLLELEIAREAHVVYVRPELVVEIAFNDVQESSQYPGRLALRFARVKRYRTDKGAAQADSFNAIRAIYREATGLEPPPPRS